MCMKFEGLLNLMDFEVRVHRDCLFLRGSDVFTINPIITYIGNRHSEAIPMYLKFSLFATYIGIN